VCPAQSSAALPPTSMSDRGREICRWLASSSGWDPHKRSATIEVINEREQTVGQGRYFTDHDGYKAMLAAGRKHGDLGSVSAAMSAAAMRTCSMSTVLVSAVLAADTEVALSRSCSLDLDM
jgi:hypothetical protein